MAALLRDAFNLRFIRKLNINFWLWLNGRPFDSTVTRTLFGVLWQNMCRCELIWKFSLTLRSFQMTRTLLQCHAFNSSIGNTLWWASLSSLAFEGRCNAWPVVLLCLRPNEMRKAIPIASKCRFRCDFNCAGCTATKCAVLRCAGPNRFPCAA